MIVGLVAVTLALPVGLFVLWPFLRRSGVPDPAAPATRDHQRTELEAEKLLKLRALRELGFERQAGHVDPEDFEVLRAQYEAQVSAVLKRLDALGPAAPAPASAGRRAERPAPAPATRVPWSRQPAFLTAAAVGLVVFGVVLGLLVVRFTGPAPPEMGAEAGPGPTLGAPPLSGAAPPAAAGAAPGAAGSGTTARPIPPGMLEGMLQAARASLNAGRLQEAITAYQAILKRQPNNVDALTHFGLILAMAGHADQALQYLDRALAVDPDYPEALSYSGQIRFEVQKDYAGAIAAWERFAKVVPNEAARAEALARVREAKTRLASAPKGAGDTPAPGSTSPTPAGSPTPPAAGIPPGPAKPQGKP